MPRALHVAVLAFAIVSAGCPENEPGLPIEEEAAGDIPLQLLSTVNVADPRANEQLLRGFHPLEQRAWRWTEQEFAVLLEPPPAALGHTPSVDLRFTIPAIVIERLGEITLAAEVNGVEVGSESYDEATENILFTKQIPPDVLTGEPAEVLFLLDKAIAAHEVDSRELGVVALSIALK